MEPIAHTRNADGARQDLESHLRGVAELARGFGEPLSAADAAWFLGLTHDIGKWDPAFQAYLARCDREPGWRGHGPDRKAAGTDLALRTLGLASMAVQGHHGGLESPAQVQAWLAEALARPAVLQAQRAAVARMPELAPATPPPVPPCAGADPIAARGRASMWGVETTQD